ncbi:MAG: tRNA glutamyl-Q(34) synthetase GluQRS [Firmicutes bacterium]|nr:tRNA glutamyl-Q(34) synthetase GluQRS [Bacillota bacterium]
MDRGRFAPTPSGSMHLGNAMTALLAWLQMRRLGGAMVLRIEDLDLARSRPFWRDQILTDLRWLGLDWDEGPDCGGPFAPYLQSERQERYRHALQTLHQAGLLYPCYCSRKDLQSIGRAPHGLIAEGPAYPGTCADLTDQEQRVRQRLKSPALRFRLPDTDGEVDDALCGAVQYPARHGGDFVVQRADGVISYQLAVVVDDAAMDITHVLRGRDLLDSTWRQVHLYKALGLRSPAFAHSPLVTSTDGARLSKSDGSRSLSALRQSGVQSETIIGALAAACGLIDRPEATSPVDLIHSFSLEKIKQNNAIVTSIPSDGGHPLPL